MSLKLVPPHRGMIGSVQNFEQVSQWAGRVDESIQQLAAAHHEIVNALGPIVNQTAPTFVGAHLIGAAPSPATPTGASGTSRKIARADHAHPVGYALGSLGADQSSNIGVNDHVKWSAATQSGAAVTLDTSSGYTTSPGASIGRFTLAAGNYLLMAALQAHTAGASGRLEFSWSDDGGTLHGVKGVSLCGSSGASDGAQPLAIAVVSLSSSALYEVRITTATTVASILALASWALARAL